jgi:choline-glycine betaine transporter
MGVYGFIAYRDGKLVSLCVFVLRRLSRVQLVAVSFLLLGFVIIGPTVYLFQALVKTWRLRGFLVNNVAAPCL